MTLLTTLCLTLLTADPQTAPPPAAQARPEARWEQAAKTDGITVFSREKEGADILEMKAIGVIDARPMEVWKAVRDLKNYPKQMPYTKEARILAVEGDDKVIWFYSKLDLPLVDNRDYVIRLVDESDWKDGAGFLKVSWTAWNEKGERQVDEQKGIVRVKVNDGYWHLEARDHGEKTFATYYVYTDPGGAVPRFIANSANKTAVPNVFAAIRKTVMDNRAAAASKKP